MAEVMPPMGQGEDPNDPNRPLTYDERKKHEESETFGIESLNIGNILDLPNDILRKILGNIEESYKERERAQYNRRVLNAQGILRDRQKEREAAEEDWNRRDWLRDDTDFLYDAFLEAEYNEEQARLMYLEANRNLIDYRETLPRTALMLAVYQRILNIHKKSN